MRASVTVIIASLSLCSCGSWSVPQPSADARIAAPEAWKAASKSHHGNISTGWLSELNSPAINKAVDQALLHNNDLQAAAARMRQARFESVIAGARRLPSADITANSNVIDRVNALTTRDHGLNLSVAWEVDLWGRLRNRHQQAIQNELAAIHNYRGARLSLAANTAKAWCNLVSANQEVELSKTILESFEKVFKIIEGKFKSDGEGALDIQFGLNNVSSARRALESRILEQTEAARSLELLLGKYPDGTTRHGAQLPTITRHAPAGLPANLLDRRPDLCASRAQLLASVEAAHASRKALLPSLSLTASSGKTSGNLSDLLDLDNLVNTLAARLTQTLTEGGAVTATARAAVESNRIQLHSYAQDALVAFREVESTLAIDRSLLIQEKFLTDEIKQATLAEKIAEREYTEGINPNILSLLEAQRRANNARASMIRLQNARIQNRIDLHLALGGDFHTPQR